jgi:hypothetical protein
VLPTQGNNDTKYHYQPAAIESGDWVFNFYKYTFDNFFKNHPANSLIPSLTQIETNWLLGGYYSVEVAPNLKVIAVNTLYYNAEDETPDSMIRKMQL